MVNRLQAPTRELLEAWPHKPDLTGAPIGPLLEGLNAIVAGPSIWDEERFADVDLRPETSELARANPAGAELARLNRLLLEDAFPWELSSRNREEWEAQVARLTKQISGAFPCGGDGREPCVYTSGNGVYDDKIGTLDSLETMIESSLARPGEPEPDWQKVKTVAEEVLRRGSKHLKVAVFWTVANMHYDRWEGLARGLTLIAVLLEKYWKGLHPQPDDGDPYERVGLIGDLASDPGGRLGFLRRVAKLEPSEGDRGSAEAALAALSRIARAFAKNAPAFEPPKLDGLTNVLREATLGPVRLGSVESAEPSQTSEMVAGGERRDAAPHPTPSTNWTGRDDALRALDKVGDFFKKVEPTSPVLPLVSLARELANKTFVEVLARLPPAPLRALEKLEPLDGNRTAAAQPPGGRLGPPFESMAQRQSAGETAVAPSDTTTNSSPQRRETAERTGVPPMGVEGTIPPVAVSQLDEARMPTSVARLRSARAGALRELADIAAFFSATEPSSPIPVLVVAALQASGWKLSTRIGEFDDAARGELTKFLKPG